MNTLKSILGISARAFRVIPSLLILSTASIGIAHYGLRMEFDRATVVAVVPMLVMFLINRILLATVPKPSEQQREDFHKHGFFIVASSVAIFLTALGSAVSIASAIFYWGLGLFSAASYSAQTGMYLFAFGSGAFLLVAIAVAANQLIQFGVIFVRVTVDRIFGIPTHIARSLRLVGHHS